MLTVLLCFVGSMLISAPIAYHFARVHVRIYSNLGIDMTTTSVHAQITMYKYATPEDRALGVGGELVFDEYHAGAVTNIGDNQTMHWVFGDSDIGDSADYLDNATQISIGNQGSLSTASTQLPGEWNRTAATVEDQVQSQINLTCTFYPDTGPYTADCIGLNWETSGDGNLWGYDTFTEVTGIDDTFTINVEFQVSTSHS